MNRVVFFAIFLLVFLTIYGLMNYYGIFRTATLFGARNVERMAAGAALLISVLFVASMALARQATQFGKSVYLLAACWAGIIFLLVCVLAIHELLRLFVTLPDTTWGVASITVTIALVIIAFALGNTIVIKEIGIESQKIEQELSIVQISDTHLGAIHGEQHLRTIAEKIRALAPDAIVITGDLIDGEGRHDPALFSILDRLGAPVFFVTGNHEIYAGEGYIDSLLSKTQVRHLKDEKIAFKGIDIIGIDDREERGVAARVLEGIARDPARFTLVLYHQPSGAQAMKGADLILAGHTHNGQIVPFNFLAALIERPVTGLHPRENDGQIYVSPGTGTWGPPMRLGSANTITRVRIVPT